MSEAKIIVDITQPQLVVFSKRVKREELNKNFKTYEELDKYLVDIINTKKYLLNHREFAYLDVFFNDKYTFYLSKVLTK